MKKELCLLSIFAVIILTSCNNGGAKDTPPPPDGFGYAAFLEQLNIHGVEYREGAVTPAETSLLSVEPKRIYVDGELISVYEYPSYEAIENDAEAIDPGGSSITYPGESTHISWASYPHFFKKDVIIVLYVGENEEIVSVLEEILGEPFAGHQRKF